MKKDNSKSKVHDPESREGSIMVCTHLLRRGQVPELNANFAQGLENSWCKALIFCSNTWPLMWTQYEVL
jgi:hypothetical protein